MLKIFLSMLKIFLSMLKIFLSMLKIFLSMLKIFFGMLKIVGGTSGIMRLGRRTAREGSYGTGSGPFPARGQSPRAVFP
jgi:hypothetical protein